MTSTATIGAGRSLDDAIRRRMEHSFGTDLSDVRVHEGPQAADAADELEARAFAYGRHVVLGRSYAPGTDAGRRLLAHELAHVVQQAGHATAAPVAAQEADANTAAARAVAGAPARVAVSTASQIALAPKDLDDEEGRGRRPESSEREQGQRERQEARHAGRERKVAAQRPSQGVSDEALESSQVAAGEINKRIKQIMGQIRETQRPTTRQQSELDRLHEELAAIQRGDAAARKAAAIEDERLHSAPARTPAQKAASRKRERQLALELNEAKGKVSEEAQATGRKNVRRQVPYFEGRELSPAEAAARLSENKRLKEAGMRSKGMRTVDEVTSRVTPEGDRQQVNVERKNNALDRMDAKGQNRAIGRVIGQLESAKRHEPKGSVQVVKFTKRPATDARPADHERKLAARIFTKTEQTEEVWFGNHRITRASAKKEIESEQAAQKAKAARKAERAAEQAERAKRKAERGKANAAKTKTPRTVKSKQPASKPSAPAAAAQPAATAGKKRGAAKRESKSAMKHEAKARVTAKPLAAPERASTRAHATTPADQPRTTPARTSTAQDAPKPAKSPVRTIRAEQTPAKPPTHAKPAVTPAQSAAPEEAAATARPPAASRRSDAQSPKAPATKPATTTAPSPVAPATGEPRKTGKPGATTRKGDTGAKVSAVAGASDQLLSVFDAAKRYSELRDEGASVSEALVQVGFDQTEVGEIKATYENAVAGGQSKGEAVVTTLGTQLGRFAPGGGGTSAVIGVINHALHTLGAPQLVTDLTGLIAEATPGSMGPQLITAGARSYYNLIDAALTGDTKGLERMAGDLRKGSLGTPLQGISQVAEGIADLAAGDDPTEVFERLAEEGKGTAAYRVGSFLGDKTYDLVEWISEEPVSIEVIRRMMEKREHAARATGGAP